MSGYTLVWLLLQEIERLKAELQSYKDKQSKTNILVQVASSHKPPVFSIQQKKNMCHHSHIPQSNERLHLTYNVIITSILLYVKLFSNIL